MRGPPLTASGVRKQFAGNVVLEGIDLRVDPGEAVALVGPNGSGKSTFIGCVCGTVIPDAGTVAIAGHDLSAAPLEARRALRYLAQESDIPPGLTGREILEIFSQVHADPTAVNRAVALADLGPAIDHLATTYSVGMRRRLLYAGMSPGAGALYVLDEPFAGVDADGRGRMLELIAGARQRGAGVLLAAHDGAEPELARLDARLVELTGATRSE